MSGASGPTPGTSGWLADPSGRHELRWYDGNTFTDSVADAGVTTSDPWRHHAVGVTPPSDVTGKRASRLPLVLAVVGALIVLVAVITLLRDDDGGGGGFGESEGEVAEGGLGVHEITVEAGTVAIVEVEPDDDLDAVVGFVLDEGDADEIAELYADSAFADDAEPTDVDEAFQADDDAIGDLGDDAVVVFRRDVGFDGDDERLFLAVTSDVDVAVVVGGFDETEGPYDITIEAVELDVDEDADGDEVLEAMVDADDVPGGIRDEIEGRLESE